MKHPPTIHWSAIALCLTCLVLDACALDATCIRHEGDDGRPVVTCPRSEPVTLSKAPDDDDATCVLLGETIRCGEEHFDAETGAWIEPEAGKDPGRDTTPQEPGSDTPDGAKAGEEFTFPIGQGATGKGSTSGCTIAGAMITCLDGVVGQRRAMSPGEHTCSSRMLPGVGRRIVCQGGDGAVEVIRPTSGVAADELVPSCSATTDGLTCTEGSVVGVDESGVDDELAQAIASGECERVELPEVSEGRAERIASCALELDCEECAGTPPLSPDCEELLEPVLTCVTDTSERGFGPEQVCLAPSRGFRLASQGSRDWLRAHECKIIRGDITLAPSASTRMEPPDLRWLGALENTRTITGSLLVEGALLPKAQEARDQWEEIDKGFGPRRILKDLVWRRVAHDQLLTRNLKRVGRDLVIDDSDVERIALLRTLEEVEGSVYITSNLWLEEVDRGGGLIISGAFVFAGNAFFSPCDMGSLVDWAIQVASSVLAVSAGKGEAGCG